MSICAQWIFSAPIYEKGTIYCKATMNCKYFNHSELVEIVFSGGILSNND